MDTLPHELLVDIYRLINNKDIFTTGKMTSLISRFMLHQSIFMRTLPENLPKNTIALSIISEMNNDVKLPKQLKYLDFIPNGAINCIIPKNIFTLFEHGNDSIEDQFQQFPKLIKFSTENENITSFPKTILHLKIPAVSCNCRKIEYPPHLKYLTCGSCSNCHMIPTRLPTTISHLKLNSYFNQEVFDWPQFIINLQFTIDYDYNIDQFPPFLTYLSTSLDNYKKIKSLPIHLTHLTIKGHFRFGKIYTIENIPKTIKNFKMRTCYKTQINHLPNLTTLIIEQDISNISKLPSSVKKLSLEYVTSLNADFLISVSKSSITHLSIPHDSQIIMKIVFDQFPSMKTLTYLKIYYNDLYIKQLPPNLTHILSNRFCNKYDIESSKITHMDVDDHNRKFPSTLIYLTLRHRSFVHELAPFPSGLKYLKFIHGYHLESLPSLPNLTHLTIINIDNISFEFPKSLIHLKISIKHIDKVPKHIKLVIFVS